jgi:hypothetical protein
MFWKKSHNGLVMLLATIIFLVGACAVMAEDSKAVWKDSATGLIWDAKDNGSAVSPNQAGQYCSSLRTGGYSDWRLPTIDELEAIYDSKVKKLSKVKGTIELSDPCLMSGSTNNSGDVWTFCFNSGSRNLGGGSGCSASAHALCVRGPEK